MLTRVGMPPGLAVKYELDHFVAVVVGGNPRSEDNLWLQRWDGAWNARVKDRLERKLQVMVCAGEINLHTARTAIQHDWHAAYRKYVASNPTAIPRGMELEEEEAVELRWLGRSAGQHHSRLTTKCRMDGTRAGRAPS